MNALKTVPFDGYPFARVRTPNLHFPGVLATTCGAFALRRAALQRAFRGAIAKLAIITIALCLALQTPASASEKQVSVGLNGISDWSTQHPFLDLMKSARPWIGHLPDQWGGVTFEDLQARGMVDDFGWPLAVPEEVTSLEALILTDQPSDAVHLAGSYNVFYDGQGRFELTGRARVTRRNDGHLVFAYSPGDGLVGLRIHTTDETDPIRNIRVIKDDHLALYDDEVLFNPDWIEKLQGFDTLRYMGWTNTNDSDVVAWKDMPQSTDFSYAWRGVPIEIMVQLANEVDANPWFNIPHLADDDLVQRFAEQVFETIEPDLTAHVEFSNEVWNFIFDQAHWASQQAERRWGEVGDGWMQYYGLRAAEVMDIWADVFGAEAPNRLTRVIAVQTGWPGLEEAALRGEHVRAALGRDPLTSFDAYAVTGYFGYELGEPAATNPLLEAAEARARDAGVAKGLSRVALREYVRTHRFDGTFPEAADMVRTGSFHELLHELWPYHARTAEAWGLELLMYEGGTHAAANWDSVDNDRLIAFLNAFNYSNEMGALYNEALNAWDAVAGTSFNVFVDVAPLSKWGSWGALRHLSDDNPRWRAIKGHVDR